MENIDTIYLDYQATTILDSHVFEEMHPYLVNAAANPHSSEHVLGWAASKAVEASSAKIAALIGGDADEVIFTSGATEANNLAMLGLARRAAGGPRRRILVGATEHKCVLEVSRVVEAELGYSISYIPVDSVGRIDLDALDEALSDDVLLVSVMAVNNEIGTTQDLREISNRTSRVGAILHSDAAQAPCALDLSSWADFVDLISLSSHKMYGPPGVGALFVRRDVQQQMSPIIHGGGQQNGLRSGTVPTALCVGLGVASSLVRGDESEHQRTIVARRRDRFLELLKSCPCSVWLNGPDDMALRHPGNVNIGFEGVAASDLLSRIQPKIAASSGSACTSGIPEPSHVLRAIGLDDESAASSIRFSLGRQTTDADVEQAATIVGDTIGEIIADGLLRAS